MHKVAVYLNVVGAILALTGITVDAMAGFWGLMPLWLVILAYSCYSGWSNYKAIK